MHAIVVAILRIIGPLDTVPASLPPLLDLPPSAASLPSLRKPFSTSPPPPSLPPPLPPTSPKRQPTHYLFLFQSVGSEIYLKGPDPSQQGSGSEAHTAICVLYPCETLALSAFPLIYDAP